MAVVWNKPKLAIQIERLDAFLTRQKYNIKSKGLNELVFSPQNCRVNSVNPADSLPYSDQAKRLPLVEASQKYLIIMLSYLAY